MTRHTFIASPPNRTDKRVRLAFAIVFALAILREILIVL